MKAFYVHSQMYWTPWNEGHQVHIIIRRRYCKLYPLPAFMFMRFQEMGTVPSKTLVSAVTDLDCQILLDEFEFPSITALSCLKVQCEK